MLKSSSSPPHNMRCSTEGKHSAQGPALQCCPGEGWDSKLADLCGKWTACHSCQRQQGQAEILTESQRIQMLSKSRTAGTKWVPSKSAGTLARPSQACINWDAAMCPHPAAGGIDAAVLSVLQKKLLPLGRASPPHHSSLSSFKQSQDKCRSLYAPHASTSGQLWPSFRLLFSGARMSGERWELARNQSIPNSGSWALCFCSRPGSDRAMAAQRLPEPLCLAAVGGGSILRPNTLPIS